MRIDWKPACLGLEDILLFAEGKKHCRTYKKCNFIHAVGVLMDNRFHAVLNSSGDIPCSKAEAMQYLWDLKLSVSDVVNKLRIF